MTQKYKFTAPYELDQAWLPSEIMVEKHHYIGEGWAAVRKQHRLYTYKKVGGVYVPCVASAALKKLVLQAILDDVPATETPAKLSVPDVLQLCANTIEGLSTALYQAQVEAYSLAHMFGNARLGNKARKQLIDQGLVIKQGSGYVLTPKGLEARIGTYCRKPDTTCQVLRFTEEVKKYVDLSTKQGKPYSTPDFNVKDPKGNILTVENVRSFSAEHGLVASKLYLLRNGSLNSTLGWSLAG